MIILHGANDDRPVRVAVDARHDHLGALQQREVHAGVGAAVGLGLAHVARRLAGGLTALVKLLADLVATGRTDLGAQTISDSVDHGVCQTRDLRPWGNAGRPIFHGLRLAFEAVAIRDLVVRSGEVGNAGCRLGRFMLDPGD